MQSHSIHTVKCYRLIIEFKILLFFNKIQFIYPHQNERNLNKNKKFNSVKSIYDNSLAKKAKLLLQTYTIGFKLKAE